MQASTRKRRTAYLRNASGGIVGKMLNKPPDLRSPDVPSLLKNAPGEAAKCSAPGCSEDERQDPSARRGHIGMRGGELLCSCCSDYRRHTVLHRGPSCRRAAPRTRRHDAAHAQHHHHIGVAQGPGGLDQACPAPLRVLEVAAEELALVPDVPGAGSQSGNLACELVCGASGGVIVAGPAAGVVGGGVFVSAGAMVVPELTTRIRRRLAGWAAVVPAGALAMMLNRRRRRV